MQIAKKNTPMQLAIVGVIIYIYHTYIGWDKQMPEILKSKLECHQFDISLSLYETRPQEFTTSHIYYITIHYKQNT